jgi:hypothetical protein
MACWSLFCFFSFSCPATTATSMHVICTLNHGLDCLYGRLLALASAADTSVPAGVSF